MYQQHMQPEESLGNNALGANRKPIAHKLVWWIGGVILLSAGSALGGECPNTVTGIFDGDHKAVYSDCARNNATNNHNILLVDGGIIASPESSTKLVPAPGSLPNPITIADSGIYGPSTGDACDLVPAGALNGSYYATMSSFKYYCAVWRDSGGREQRISAKWEGSSFGFTDYSMTDTAIVDPPKVDLTVGDAMAAEAGPNQGSFVISRDGGIISQALQLRVAVSGTATIDADYTPSPSMTWLDGNIYQVTIPPDQLTASILITPINDGIIEDDETVIFTLVDDTTYTVGEAGPASIIIADFVGGIFKDSFEGPQ